jgi:SAM-dependent methyltransferase
MDDTRPFWESFYGDKSRAWSGKPNAMLVQHVTGIEPGRALDIGCGEGADAIWLAEQGWQVTAVDIAQVALERAAALARVVGVEDRVDWQRHDLAVSLPSGPFDLVSAVYFHSPVNMPRDRILRKAAHSVAQGGTLLVVGHAGTPHVSEHHDSVPQYPAPRELLATLDLADEWRVEVLESFPRSIETPDRRRVDIQDTVVMLRR